MSGLTLRDRAVGALWGIFFADALSMPVHWFYDVGEIDRRFGRITKYENPSEPHPSSIMRLHSTGGGGRGEQTSSVVGDVILKGKKHLWGVPAMHYHHGMRAGENTLNAQCARLVMRGITERGGVYDGEGFLADYVKFMTSEGSHNDTYAESYHRDFFANYAQGLPPNQCCGKEGHDTPSVGGLVTIAPVVLACLIKGGGDDRAIVDTALQHLHWTHRSKSLDKYAEAYVRLLISLFRGSASASPPQQQLREAVVRAGNAVGIDVADLANNKGRTEDRAVVGKVVSTACYISDSFPAVLFLAYKYADNPQAAIEANTRCGGENCHRGSVLATIVGAAHGVGGFAPHMLSGLVARDEIEREIEGFLRGV